jgi:hypothetical protein
MKRYVNPDVFKSATYPLSASGTYVIPNLVELN